MSDISLSPTEPIPPEGLALWNFRRKVIKEIQNSVARSINSPLVAIEQQTVILKALKSTLAVDVNELGFVHENTLSTIILAELRDKILRAEKVGRQCAATELAKKPRLPMMSKKLKILAVISTVWIVAICAVASPGHGAFMLGPFLNQFCIIGILPIVIVWGGVWIFQKDGK